MGIDVAHYVARPPGKPPCLRDTVGTP
jgi:hypothetical protein